MSGGSVNYIEGEIVVMYATGTDPKDVESVIRTKFSLDIISHESAHSCFIVEVPEGEEETWMADLMEEDEVQACFRYSNNMKF
jgi:hypothetical protein